MLPYRSDVASGYHAAVGKDALMEGAHCTAERLSLSQIDMKLGIFLRHAEPQQATTS